jgi:hypothetical protein
MFGSLAAASPGDVRRQALVGRQKRQELWDDPDLA